MDGVSAVVLFVVVMFFMHGQPQGSASQSTVQDNRNQTQPTVTLSTGATFSTSTSQGPGFTQTETDPNINYVTIDSDRMDRIILKYNANLSQAKLEEIKSAVRLYCMKEDLDPKLILALMARESAFQAEARSPTGATGLGQILPMNYDSLEITEPTNIDQNTRGTVVYFKSKLSEWVGYANQLGLALASYLEGAGTVRRNGNRYSEHAQLYINDILRIRNSI